MKSAWQRVTIGIASAVALAACGAIVTLNRGPALPSDPGLRQALRDLRATLPWHYRLANSSRLARRILPASWYSYRRDLETILKVQSLHSKAVEHFRLAGTNAWPAIPALLALLDSHDVGIRNYAALSLAKVQATDHPEWPEMSRVLRGRSRAAQTLCNLVSRAFPGEPFPDTRWPTFGLLGLSAVGPAADWTRPELIQCVRAQQDPAIRAAAVFALGRLTPDPTNGLPLLRQLLTNASEWPEVSAAAAIALVPFAKNNEGIAECLRQGLEDPRARVRIAAAEAVRMLGRPSSEVMPVLTPLLRHPMRRVRIKTLRALGGIGPDAREALSSIRALEADPDPGVARGASDAAKRIAGTSE
ncbi:MAG: HEAT repeat domain-containing protein [Verrucomicrobiae bacterium]|nr:HEAT repeat domain-containing protein [Verrucomicrobiae bacterium]